MKKKIVMCLTCALAAVFASLSLSACGEEDKTPTIVVPPPVTVEYPVTVDWDYKTWEYTNTNGAKATLNYAVYIPETSGDEKLPLITWIPDSSFLARNIQSVASADSCPTVWATDANLKDNPAAFLVLTLTRNSYTDSAEGDYLDGLDETGSEESQVVNIIDAMVEEFNLDEDRLYLTGQSMGGIFEWALNTRYPDKFAATVYVGCQPGGDVSTEEAPVEMYDFILERAEFLNQKFVYIASRLDGKSAMGQDDVEAVFTENGVDYFKDYTLDYTNPDGNSQYLKDDVFTLGYNNYFLAFPSVTDGDLTTEHNASFKLSYQISAIFEWLLQQKLIISND